jgi:hypothetical protein
MEMVKQIITNLEIDRSFIIRNVTDLALNVIRSEAQDRVDLNKLRQQIDSIQNKKIAALLRDKIRKTNDTDYSAHFPGICEINKEVKLIMSCANAPESFYKVLLEYIIVHSDGTAQIGIGIEGCLELLSVDLSVLVQNVCVDADDPADQPFNQGCCPCREEKAQLISLLKRALPQGRDFLCLCAAVLTFLAKYVSETPCNFCCILGLRMLDLHVRD